MFRPCRFHLILAIVLQAALVLPARAHEPSGYFHFQVDTIPAAADESNPAPDGLGALPPAPLPDLDPGERLLKITIVAASPIGEIALLHTAPSGSTQRLVSVLQGGIERRIDRGEGDPSSRIPLGALGRGQGVVLTFGEKIAEGSGGIAAFTIEAIDPGGSPIRERFSVAVGEIGVRGNLRGGAVEYPAHLLPRTEP